MLYDFAVTPDVFSADRLKEDSADFVILKELLRGLAINGVILIPENNRWHPRILQKMAAGCSPDVRDAVLACLSTLDGRNRLISREAATSLDWSADTHWLDWALECHGQIVCHAIVLSDILMNSSGRREKVITTLSKVLDTEAWQSRRHSVPLLKCERDFRTHLTPLLRHAGKVTLIDPYFSTERRYRRTLELVAELLGSCHRSRLGGTIEIHTGDSRAQNWDLSSSADRGKREELLNEWKQLLQRFRSRGRHTIRVRMWRQKPDVEQAKKMHDRYIITDQCGVSAPGGLDCFDDDGAYNSEWILLEYEHCAARLKDFQRSSSPYEIIGEAECSPTNAS